MTEEVWGKIKDCDMLLVGIGSRLSVTEDNAEEVDEVYRTLARLTENRRFFVITGNRDGKLNDGTIDPAHVAAPMADGADKELQDSQWEAYMKWLSLSLNKKLTVLELGEGFANPEFMRWPFERVVTLNQKSCLIRVSPSLYQIPEQLGERGISVREECTVFAAKLREKLS